MADRRRPMRTLVRAPAIALAIATLLAAGLGVGAGLVAPQVAVACSCVARMPLAQYAGEGTVIFAGTVAADDGTSVLFAVDTWFSGSGGAPTIGIEGDFGNGASCGVGMRPPVGSSWFVVGGRMAEGGIPAQLTGVPVLVSICSPFVDLATSEGQALLDEAVATFGGSEPGPTASEVPSPAAAGTPAPSPSATAGDGDGPSTETLVAAGIGTTLLAGVAVLAIVLLVARRRSTPS